MQTLLRSFTLFAALVGVITITGLPAAPAQVKDKKDDKAKADPSAEEAGTVEVYKAKDGWRFRIKSAGGKSLAIGTVGFEKKEDALKTLDAIKATLAKGKVIEMKEDKK
jgi:uncharacterized protein YegP (UPF0339 family)